MKIAVVNNKGGVGKTTLSIIVSQILAAAGEATAIFDTDHQQNAATALLNETGSVIENLTVIRSAGRTPKAAHFDDFSHVVVDTGPAQESAIIRNLTGMVDVVLCPIFLHPDAYDGYQKIFKLAGESVRLVVLGGANSELKRSMLAMLQEVNPPFALLPTSELIVKNIANQVYWHRGLSGALKEPYYHMMRKVRGK